MNSLVPIYYLQVYGVIPDNHQSITKTPPMHPAKKIPFDELIAGLDAAKAMGHVSSKDCPEGRRIYIYTNRCVYENGWDDFSLLARGLIVDPESKRVLALPFPKFFNAGEMNRTIPDLPFEVFEKLDGSLGILHYFNSRWRASTKGSFDSEQALWIEARLAAQDTSALIPGVTYLVEAIYPENRIVIRYDTSELVLLAAYLESGQEMSFDELSETAGRLRWRVAKRHSFSSFSELVEHARMLPATEEGFVIRFSDGLRLKLKGEEYRRIHALISRCTPLAMWEAMQAGDDLEAIRRDLPEEFWGDFDAIISALAARIDSIKAKVSVTAQKLADATDKEVGLQLKSLDPEVRPLIFHWRKAGGNIDGRASETLFRMIRPTGNALPGYVPSRAMDRVADEMA